MELVTASDLFVTASLAILLSVLVAKLVSMAMASDPHSHNTHQPIITMQRERLTVQKPQSESRVEFLGPIQVSTNVETEQNREEQEETEQNREEQVESKVVVELQAVMPEDIAVEFGVSNVGVLVEEHVEEEKEEEEEELTETNEESEQQRKTEETTAETSGSKESEQQRKIEDCTKQRKTEETAAETSGVKESEQQRKTKDFKEQRKTEETAVEPFNEKGISAGESHVKEGDDDEDDDGNVVIDDDDDDDWEGIERSELEKAFMMATEFVGGDGLGSDVQMELYGLHKIATEGPCREPQPMPFKLSARAKWNAWQKLGNMSPDVAMEQYISLISDKVPGWKKDSSSAGMSEHEHKGSEVSESAAPDLSTSLSHQQMIITERELEQESGARDHSTLEETDLENNVKK